MTTNTRAARTDTTDTSTELETKSLEPTEDKAAAKPAAKHDDDADVEITLAMHYEDKLPGDKIKVSPERARQLTAAGYAARTD